MQAKYLKSLVCTRASIGFLGIQEHELCCGCVRISWVFISKTSMYHVQKIALQQTPLKYKYNYMSVWYQFEESDTQERYDRT